MKKILLCLTIFSFLLILFGCTKNDNPTEPETQTPDVPTDTVNPTPEDPTESVNPTPTPVVPQTFYTTSSGDVSENEGIPSLPVNF